MAGEGVMVGVGVSLGIGVGLSVEVGTLGGKKRIANRVAPARPTRNTPTQHKSTNAALTEIKRGSRLFI